MVNIEFEVKGVNVKLDGETGKVGSLMILLSELDEVKKGKRGRPKKVKMGRPRKNKKKDGRVIRFKRMQARSVELEKKGYSHKQAMKKAANEWKEGRL